MSGYGYTDDEKQSSSSVKFGLNQKVFMTKFEFNANGGKDGAALECLDIVFEFPGGAVRSYRQFPITKAKDKDGNDVTDPKAKEMIKAFNEFNAKIMQIMKCYVDEDTLKAALTTVRNFREFCTTLSRLLPTNFAEQPIDVFTQYQWQPRGDGDSKYMEIPSKVNQGKVFTAHTEGDFKAVKIEGEGDELTLNYNGEALEYSKEGKRILFTINGKDLSMDEKTGLIYVDENGNIHPITRTAWFMKSNWAKSTNEDAPIQSNWD